MSALRDAGTEVRAVAVGIDHPEAVAWHGGHLYCGTEGGDVLRIDPAAGSCEIVAQPGGFLLGLAFDGAATASPATRPAGGSCGSHRTARRRPCSTPWRVAS